MLPGHGRAVVDHRALIDERFEHYKSRAAEILELIRQRPRSAHELAQELWGRRRAVVQAYLTTSEILGHVDLLLERGQVDEIDDGEAARFEAR